MGVARNVFLSLLTLFVVPMIIVASGSRRNVDGRNRGLLRSSGACIAEQRYQAQAERSNHRYVSKHTIILVSGRLESVELEITPPSMQFRQLQQLPMLFSKSCGNCFVPVTLVKTL